MTSLEQVAERKRIQIKESLAKLMATENLIVEHAAIPTAAFDLVNRKLLIPQWTNISEDVYTLLISHEVGHALYTPLEEWMPAIKEEKNRNFKSTVNIVEDARIEKMIQAKYPGATRSFKSGYAELQAQDLFGTQSSKKKPEDYGILDRINLHYKLGHYGYFDVPFLDTEKHWLTQIDRASTFQEVLSISKKLLKYAEEEAEAKNIDLNQQDGDCDGEEPLEMTEEELKRGLEDGSIVLSKDGKGRRVKVLCETQDSFDKKMANRTDLTSKIYNLNIPQHDLSKVIVDYKTVYKQLNETYTKHGLVRASAAEDLSAFKSNNRDTVNQLVNLFEMKKRAKSDSRSKIAKTGVLDTNKLHSYKYNDDLFRRVTNIPTGKSHGLVVLFDMSGSMTTNMAGTISQMINIAMFCRKVNIPFEVYGFGDCGPEGEVPTKLQEIFFCRGFSLRNYLSSKQTTAEYNDMLECLMCIIRKYTDGNVPSSVYETLGGTPLNDAIIAMMQFVPQFRAKYNLDTVHTVILTDGEGTSGLWFHEQTTPADVGAAAAAISPIPPTCVGNYGSLVGEVYARHKNSSKSWHLTKAPRDRTSARYTSINLTANLIDMFRDITQSKMIGFYVTSLEQASSLIRSLSPVADANKQISSFEDKHFAEIRENGYDSYYLIPEGKNLLSRGDKVDFSESTSQNLVYKQFIRAMSKKKSSRVLLNKFIDHIA